jgi:hypothetical protein
MHHHPGVSIMDFTSGRSSGNETSNVMKESLDVYQVMPRKDKRGIDLISDALPFGRLWYSEPNAVENAIGYAKHRSRSHDAVIRVYDERGPRDRDARA